MIRKYIQLPNQTPAKLALVGEAPGAEEVIKGQPFVGQAGKLLDELLEEASLLRKEILITNVFSKRPLANDVSQFFIKRKEAKGSPYNSPFKPFGNLGFLREEYEGEIARLKEEVNSVSPNLVVVLGATALWATTQLCGISNYRGRILWSPFLSCKVLPTYHPAYILRNWGARPITSIDFKLAQQECQFPDVRRPLRNIFIATTPLDIDTFYKNFIVGAVRIAVDVETDRQTRQITCVSIAPSPQNALVIPFWDFSKSPPHYWSEEDECLVYLKLKQLLESPLPKVGQNFTYDLTYFAEMEIYPGGVIDDTMLKAHAYQPEMEKTLGFLASIILNDIPWKQYGHKPKNQENKKDQ